MKMWLNLSDMPEYEWKIHVQSVLTRQNSEAEILRLLKQFL